MANKKIVMQKLWRTYKRFMSAFRKKPPRSFESFCKWWGGLDLAARRSYCADYESGYKRTVEAVAQQILKTFRKRKAELKKRKVNFQLTYLQVHGIQRGSVRCHYRFFISVSDKAARIAGRKLFVKIAQAMAPKTVIFVSTTRVLESTAVKGVLVWDR